MLRFFKCLFCQHPRSALNRWHICHGPNGNDPAEIEAEYICTLCGKISYSHYSVEYKENFEKICPQYERRIK